MDNNNKILKIKKDSGNSIVNLDLKLGKIN
jgi:hypothetical protein